MFSRKMKGMLSSQSFCSRILIIQFYIIINHKWKLQTDCSNFTYTTCAALCNDVDTRLGREKRTQELSLRFIAMENWDLKFKMTIFMKKNSNRWKFWSLFRTYKNISDVNVKRTWLIEELETNTHQNATAGRVLYMLKSA